MRIISILMFIVGIGFFTFGGYHILKTSNEQDHALKNAEKLVSNNHANNVNSTTSFNDHKLEKGEEIGVLILPKLDEKLPIIEGVDEDELDKGVGHYDGTFLPSEQGQVVLSGHRDTVFQRIGELDIGDELIVKMPYGDFTYVLEETEIVDQDNLTVIDPDSHNEEILTVTTCYPFGYVGKAPQRYIMHATPEK